MDNGWLKMNKSGENKDSEESPLTSSSDTNTYLNLGQISHQVPPQISLTIPTESNQTLKMVEEGPKSCLKSKKRMTNQKQQAAEDRRRNTIFIPVDRLQDKEKAAMAMGYQRSKNRRLKTNQEKVYMFLEHPAGWAGFFYHISV